MIISTGVSTTILLTLICHVNYFETTRFLAVNQSSDLRPIVQDLNLKQGQRAEFVAQALAESEIYDAPPTTTSTLAATAPAPACAPTTSSKWAAYHEDDDNVGAGVEFRNSDCVERGGDNEEHYNAREVSNHVL